MKPTPERPPYAWFVSFAPYSDPKYVVVVQLEKSGGFGGSMCAPVARKVYDYMYQPKQSPKLEQAPQRLGDKTSKPRGSKLAMGEIP